MSKDELDYSAYEELPTDEVMAVLYSLVTELADAELLVAETGKKLKDAAKRVEEISTRLLPEKMGDLGMREVTLRNGLTIKINKAVYASLPKKDAERYERGLQWLAANGYEKSVKRQLVAEFGKGRQEEAEKLAEKLREENFNVATTKEIHPSTLSALIKGWVDSGAEDEKAEEIFGIRRVDVAKVK